ncbi:hypothetical protein CALCODRAFT_488933 [Calocera cornea HHB12733]|uniref:Uncharacterized protein n=1 Tax=Calocera cornea HHB12733 TaxID=1353952 RepID=A0A165C287_9BASI|nr:hypothetical protein CALCODRAFT_488933 [Calocera cornea HHB12733]
MPWTLLLNLPTNNALMAIAKEPAATTAEVEKDPDARKRREEGKTLLGRWRWLNATRSVGPTIGALIGGAVTGTMICSTAVTTFGRCYTGNIIGLHFYKPEESPMFKTAVISMLARYCIKTGVSIVLGVSMRNENVRGMRHE